jgi:hypothetical protein
MDQELRMTSARRKSPRQWTISASPARLDPKIIHRLLMQDYGLTAGAEALLRAFLAERDHDHSGGRFWVRVYGLILKTNRR